MMALLARGSPARGLGALAARSLANQWRGFSAQPTVEIYQYEICPFCCKVKAFLDWQKIAYHTKEVNPLTKAELKFSPDYRKVPIAIVDGQQVNDSQQIISEIVAKLTGSSALQEAMADAETQKWLRWVDSDLAVLLFPNITRSFSESFQAFRYVSEVPTFSAPSKVANQLAGSLAMWLANGKLKKKYNITDERKQLLETVQVWMDAVGSGPFLGGKEPHVADVVVFGVLSSIRGMATYDELMAAKPELARWSNDMRTALGTSMRQELTPVVRHFGPTAA
mmetsp:Transcript_40444/g.75769  ORF Transcript_40444/g.75769 Transcript_40444/m.75769 type:complete len:280 (+) Transcript_40444:44-883(+)